MHAGRKPRPSEVSGGELAFAAPYLALVYEDAPRRALVLRDAFNMLHWSCTHLPLTLHAERPAYTTAAIYLQARRDGRPKASSRRRLTIYERCFA